MFYSKYEQSYLCSNTHQRTEAVKTVDDVYERSLASLHQVGGLEERHLRHAVLS